MKLINEFKKVKIAKCIAVGGMISLGKSTIIKELEKDGIGIACYELAKDNGDHTRQKLHDILLEGLYAKTIKPELFQLAFVTDRFEQYKKMLSENKNDFILFDRTIFEDRLFAHQNMLDRPIQFNYYTKL
jgi:deoxyadenosine/deoxycytidine kinase